MLSGALRQKSQMTVRSGQYHPRRSGWVRSLVAPERITAGPKRLRTRYREGGTDPAQVRLLTIGQARSG